MKCITSLNDLAEAVSESAGFRIGIRASVANGNAVDTFETDIVVPWAASVVLMATTIRTAVIQTAAGRGHTLVANDITIAGGLM